MDRMRAIEGWAMNSSVKQVRNYVGGQWTVPTGHEVAEVWNPANGGVTAKVRSSSQAIEFFTQTRVVVERWP